MCQVDTSKEDAYLYCSEDFTPPNHITTEGEKFIKLVSQNQLNKIANVEKIQNGANRFAHGSSLPAVPSNIAGLSNLQTFEIFLTQRDGPATSKITENQGQKCASSISELFNNDLGRHYQEVALSLKPNSKETKLLSYFLSNKCLTKRTNDPVNEKALINVLENHKKYYNDCDEKIEKVKRLRLQLLKVSPPYKNVSCVVKKKSLWDVKKGMKFPIPQTGVPKLYGCERDTINKESRIMSSEDQMHLFIREHELNKYQFGMKSDEYIRSLEKFRNFSRGPVSNVLFVKNISPRVTEKDFTGLILSALKNHGISFKGTTCRLMKGKMKGQAFVTLKNEKDATAVLELLNGTVLSGKPIILQYCHQK